MLRFALPLIALSLAVPASAAITWADWASATPTLATGTIGATTVTIGGPFDYVCTTGCYDYWRVSGNPYAAYDGVFNLPTNGDVISPAGNGTAHVITFSAPVLNPYIAIISLGRTNQLTSWTFDQAFTVVDQGPGFWGSGAFTVSGNTITAGEAHGIIQFTGLYTSLTLTSDNTENWSGLSIGAAAVPEPATWAMLIAGFGLVGFAARRRRETSVSA